MEKRASQKFQHSSAANTLKAYARSVAEALERLRPLRTFFILHSSLLTYNFLYNSSLSPKFGKYPLNCLS